MAKKKATVLYKLLSSAGTGYFYVGEKNTRLKNINLFFKLIYEKICCKKIMYEKI